MIALFQLLNRATLVLLILLWTYPSVAVAASGVKTVNPADVFSVTATTGKVYRCIEIKRKFLAGTLRGNKFNSFENLTRTLKLSLRNVASRKRTKVLAQLKRSSLNQRIGNATCRAYANRPKAESQFVQANENSPIQITLRGTSRNSEILSFVLAGPPSHGTVEISGSIATYSPTMHYLGSDQFSFTAKDSHGQSDPAQITVGINQAMAEFAGQADSLEPYRTTLTAREKRHLLRKIAFGGSYELLNDDRPVELNTVVDRLMNCDDAGLEAQAMTLATKLMFISTITGKPLWNYNAAQAYWLYYMINGCPLKEKMALFLHNHAATDIRPLNNDDSFHHYIKFYMNDVRDSALGNLKTFIQKLHLSYYSAIYLDNSNNRFHANTGEYEPNENYAREFLELVTMGARDWYTGIDNYTEDDVRDGVMKALSGFKSPVYDNPRSISYAHSDHYPGDITVFSGMPWEVHFEGANREDDPTNYDYRNLTEHILYNVPYSAKYLGGKLFAVLVHPNPTEAEAIKVGEMLKASDYDLKKVVKALITSSAMFSEAARRPCVAEPVEALLTFLRSANLPVSQDATFTTLRQALTNTQQDLLTQSSVFGRNSCGINRTHDQINIGEVELSTQIRLELQNGINSILSSIDTNEPPRAGSSHDFLRLLPFGAATTDLQLVDHFAKIFEVDLSSTEKVKLIDYLNKTWTGGSNYSNTPWSTADATRRRYKVSGLLWLMGTSIMALTK